MADDMENCLTRLAVDYHDAKLIRDIGDFSHVITLPMPQCYTMKLQLPKLYPEEAPTCLLVPPTKHKATCDGEVLSKEYESLVQNTTFQTSQDIINFAATTQHLFEKFSSTTLNEPLDSSSKKVNESKGKKKSKRSSPKCEIEEKGTKMTSMKTSLDVIHRIMWDTQLSPMDFHVGYLDRFLGIQEKSFEDFNWVDDISTVVFDLAIPKHRIHYFKYKKRFVWDKNKRLDLVFNSTNDGMTITDVISDYDDWYDREKDRLLEEEQKSQYVICPGDDSDTDDEDCNIVKMPQLKDTSELDSWQNKLRPNHFLCLRVTSPEVRANIRVVQEGLIAHEPVYEECCMVPEMLHITLCMLGLDDFGQIMRCVEAIKSDLEMVKDVFAKKDSQRAVKLDGIGSFFGGRCIYAKIKEDDGRRTLLELADTLRQILGAEGIQIRDNYAFMPHLTISKISRPAARKLKTSFIDPLTYKGYENMKFGEAEMDEIHLCVINDNRREDGFYESLYSFSLSDICAS